MTLKEPNAGLLTVAEGLCCCNNMKENSTGRRMCGAGGDGRRNPYTFKTVSRRIIIAIKAQKGQYFI